MVNNSVSIKDLIILIVMIDATTVSRYSYSMMVTSQIFLHELNEVKTVTYKL